MSVRRCAFLCLAVLLIASLSVSPRVKASEAAASSQQEPLKVLLITGGCCHDYDFQTKAMQLAFQQRDIPAVWTVVKEGGTGTSAQIDLYEDPNWAEGFDLVVHNECFANTSDSKYIRRITEAHREGAAAVVIHCAMHTYRAAEIDDWRKFLGVTSRRHEHQSNYPVEIAEPEHPIMAGFPSDYTTAKDELYVIEKVWPQTTVLATSESEKTDQAHPVFWTNQYGKARVFGTTYGHSNATFQDDVFLQTLVRGALWAAGRLE